MDVDIDVDLEVDVDMVIDVVVDMDVDINIDDASINLEPKGDPSNHVPDDFGVSDKVANKLDTDIEG